MSTLSWDFGLNVDLVCQNPLKIRRLEWSTEGYQLFMLKLHPEKDKSNVLQLQFVKSALSMNPCMTTSPHILLQGDDCLYLNQGNNLELTYAGSHGTFPSSGLGSDEDISGDGDCLELKQSPHTGSILTESKYWTVLQLPLNYAATNWPIIAYFRRTEDSLRQYGANQLIVWKPDSRQLALLTASGSLLLYQLDFEANGMGILQQIDPPAASLKRDSAELFIKENIPVT